MARKKLTMREICNIIDNEWSDEDDKVHNVTVIPPGNVDYITDEEILDDEEIVMNDSAPALIEVAGALEYETRGDIEGNTESTIVPNLPTAQDDEEVVDVEPMNILSTPAHQKNKRARNSSSFTQSQQSLNKNLSYPPLSSFGSPKLVMNPGTYNIHPEPEPLTEVQKQLFEQIKDLDTLQLFYKFIDDEVLNHIVEQTQLYAAQKNVTLDFNSVTLKRFLGILILSGFHTLPSVPDYWSTKATLGVPIVRQAGSSNSVETRRKYCIPFET
ncbi:hypothetical protein ACFFRR_006632 [Megaselia abdita]